MDPRTFAVERLGVGDWPRVTGEDGSVISVKAWLSLVDPRSQPVDPLIFALDVSPDRSSAAVAVAARRDDGLVHVEVMRTSAGRAGSLTGCRSACRSMSRTRRCSMAGGRRRH
jgi:hypothetical protein